MLFWAALDHTLSDGKLLLLSRPGDGAFDGGGLPYFPPGGEG